MEEEEERIIEVNKFFEGGNGFVSCDDDSLPRGWYGGTKMLETNVYIGSFNYLNLSDLVEHLKTQVRWTDDPRNVQLIVQEQHDDKFRIIEPFD